MMDDFSIWATPSRCASKSAAIQSTRTLTFFYYLSGARAIIKEGIVFGCCVRVDWIATDILAQRDGFV